MKEETKNNKLVEEIGQLAKKHKLTPYQFRSITKEVRKKYNLRVPKSKKSLPDYLNPAEIYKLLEISKDNAFSNILIEFMIFTGCRLSETRNLLISSIDWYNNQLKIISGKGNKDRYIPITLNIQSKLKLFLKNRNKGYLFARNDLKPYTTRSLRYKIQKEIDKCNFEKHLYPHSLRHTFACLCLSKGLSLEQIKLLMGHENIKTTEIYAKIELSTIKNQFLQLMQGGAEIEN